MTAPSDPLFFDLQETLAGRYSLDLELGRGGMGIVYLARDVRLDRPVALKVLPETLAERSDVRDRFLREARTAAKLSHPNIVPIHSVEEVDRHVFFAMSYIAGETLGERVQRRGPVAAAELMRILREVAWALSYAHGQGVIHRDIKPDNILLEEGSGRALVADFGIAGLMEGSGTTGVGEVIGTAEFMSPEQASGRGVDARSDIYSLGMVALYAMSGKLPFPQHSVLETLELVRSGPQLSVRAEVPSAPRRLTRIADHCLKRDPNERFQSADQLAEAIDAVAAQRKNIPVAVRNFIYDPVDLGGEGATYVWISSMMAIPAAALALVVPEIGLPTLIAGSVYFAGAPSLVLPSRIRRLLRSGNTLADLEVALKQDLEQRREETPPFHPTAWGRFRAKLFRYGLVSAGTSWASAWVALLIPYLAAVNMTDAAAGLLGLTAASLGVAFIGRGGLGGPAHRDLRKAERRARFWQGKMGKWLFKVCGTGLKPRATTIRATHRPTELQIGLAAEALFEALPAPLKKTLGDVPGMVAGLEGDASKLRRSLEKLNEAELSGLPLNLQLPADLKETRHEAEQQLSEVVAALETIRLGLLRLTAGAGTVEGLTTHLDAAADVGSRVSHLLHGIGEVEAALVSSGEFDIDDLDGMG